MTPPNSTTTTTAKSSKVAVSARVPAELGQWVREQAAREQRDVGVVVARALATYKLACEQDGLDQPHVASALPLQGSGESDQRLPITAP